MVKCLHNALEALSLIFNTTEKGEREEGSYVRQWLPCSILYHLSVNYPMKAYMLMSWYPAHSTLDEAGLVDGSYIIGGVPLKGMLSYKLLPLFLRFLSDMR